MGDKNIQHYVQCSAHLANFYVISLCGIVDKAVALSIYRREFESS